ncbi:40S ribosomal protein S25 [Malassezia sp. CBS 17886]|nr:40S ribosomal protein S25 [Malassezia sp. CBS 17886]
MAILEEIPVDDATGALPEGVRLRHVADAVMNGSLPSDADSVHAADSGAWVLEDSDSDVADDDLVESNAQELYERMTDDQLGASTESVLDLIIWCMPFLFIFSLMNVLVQQQYGMDISPAQEVKTVLARSPFLILLVRWTMKERRRALVQSVLIILGTLSGCYFIKLVNEAPYLLAMSRTPALGTLWIFTVMPPKKSAISAAASKTGKKKKWSKGKVKDKAQNAVVLDKVLYERVLKEVPTFKMITPSILIDRLKINGSLARLAIRHFEREGQIKPLIHHNGQLVYSMWFLQA